MALQRGWVAGWRCPSPLPCLLGMASSRCVGHSTLTRDPGCRPLSGRRLCVWHSDVRALCRPARLARLPLRRGVGRAERHTAAGQARHHGVTRCILCHARRRRAPQPRPPAAPRCAVAHCTHAHVGCSHPTTSPRRAAGSQVFEAVALSRRRPPVPPSMPRPLGLLMQHCWAHEPGDRPDFDTVLKILKALHAVAAGGEDDTATDDTRG